MKSYAMMKIWAAAGIPLTFPGNFGRNTGKPGMPPSCTLHNFREESGRRMFA